MFFKLIKVNFNAFFKLIKVHLLVSELYIYYIYLSKESKYQLLRNTSYTIFKTGTEKMEFTKSGKVKNKLLYLRLKISI